MSRFIAICLLLFSFRCAALENKDFRCRECGSVLSDLYSVLDEEADDSEGKYRDESIREDYRLYYDTFPEHVNFVYVSNE